MVDVVEENQDQQECVDKQDIDDGLLALVEKMKSFHMLRAVSEMSKPYNFL